MSIPSGYDWTFDKEAFSGVARLFPLPNLVLFPHVMQPLHVFEERYREMLEDALADDELIAMTTLEPGWEPDYDSRPPIAQVGCLGKIVTHRRLDDGRYNVLLLGVQRIEIVREVGPVRSFRQAEVKLLSDFFADDGSLDSEALREELLDAFQRQLPSGCQPAEQMEELLSHSIPLGALTDLVSYAIPLELPLKQRLLAECCVEKRAQMLIRHLECDEELMAAIAGSGFPPPFSTN